MRTELIHLIDKPVAVYGYVTTVTNNSKRACLKKPFIYPWSFHKTLGQQPVRWDKKGDPARGDVVKTDHLWLINTVEGMEEGIRMHPTGDSCLYSRVFTGGYIEKYKRANGTEDIGLRPIPVMHSGLWEHLITLDKGGRYKELIEEATKLEKRGSVLFSCHARKTPKEMERHLRRLRQGAEQKLARSK